MMFLLLARLTTGCTVAVGEEDAFGVADAVVIVVPFETSFTVPAVLWEEPEFCVPAVPVFVFLAPVPPASALAPVVGVRLADGDAVR
jgi:hypothetical protein